MKLYEVRNGYTGESIVKCFIIAETEKRALELASESLREDSKWKYGKHIYDDEKHQYNEEYWTHLTIKCLCKDTSKEYKGDARDY